MTETLATAWVLTDGKAGDENPCLGVTEALGIVAERRHVRPRRPFAWLAPRGPIDPAEAAGRPGSPIAPPYPDLLVASGRRAVPYVRAVKRGSGGRTFAVILKDPRIGPAAADLIWVQSHDGLRGRNVIATVTAPHRVSAARLFELRAHPDPALAALRGPRVGVLLGGDSRHHRFRPDDVARLLAGLRAIAAAGASLMVTTSRRTPQALADAVRGLTRETGGAVDPGGAAGLYPPILALADAIVVTADSTNMVGEAVATGAPVHVFEPSGGHPKLTAFLEALARHGAVRQFTDRLEEFTYEPLDNTALVAAAVREGLDRHRAAFVRSQARDTQG